MTVSSTLRGLPAWAIVSDKREAHIRRVVELVSVWAEVMAIEPGERDRWLRAAWLHDAMKDHDLVRPPDLPPEWPDSIMHGPAAAERAARHGERDTGVLLAVRYHSVGHPDWDRAGRVLYCADFLEPGRRTATGERARLAERFPAEPDQVLFEVARWRVAHLISSGWPILEPTWRFWNALVAASR